MKVAILILLATALIAGSAADECTFPATPAASAPTVVTNIFPSTPVFFTKVADMKTCMGKIPVDTALTTSTISALTTAANLYSFTDLAKASSGVDHVVNVDLITQLDAIGKASYTSQVAVFYDLVKLFRSLKDYHAVFFAPEPMGRMYAVGPYSLEASLNGAGEMQFTVSAGPLGAEFATRFATVDPSPHYGKVLAKIAGQDINTWVKDFAAGIGRYKSVGAQVNDLFGNGVRAGYQASPGGLFGLRPLSQFSAFDEADSYEYTFTDGSIVTIANGVFGVSYFTDINTFAEKMKPQTKRSIEEETNLGISNEARDFLFAPGSRARSLYDLLPADMPANEKVQQVFSTSDARKRSVEAAPTGSPYLLLEVGSETIGDVIVSYSLRNSSTTGSFDAAVFKILNFNPVVAGSDPAQFGFTQFYAQLRQALSQSKGRQLKRLILDVTNNVGGSVAVAEAVAMDLVKEWDGGNTNGIQNGYITFDQRKTTVSNDVAGSGGLANTLNLLRTTTDFTVPSLAQYYTNGRNRTRAGQTGEFSQLAFFNGNADLGNPTQGPFTSNPHQFWFDQILVLTDGRCGSACSQFITHLRAHDRVRVAFVGGLKDDADHDISSYSGGVRYSYTGFRTNFYPALPAYPVTGDGATFNFLESYSNCYDAGLTTAIPRDFNRIVPDTYIYNWNAVHYDIRAGDATGVANAINLYQAAFNVFPQIPFGLPTYNRTRVATDVCGGAELIETLTPVPGLSADCVGEWIDTSACTVSCGGGEKEQVFKMYVQGLPSGTQCPAVDGGTQTTACNTHDCDCVYTWKNSSMCQSSCTKEETFRITSGPTCPFAEGHKRTTACGPAGTDFCEFKLSTNATNTVRAPVIPILHCVDIGTGLAKIGVAYFGYHNLNDFDVTIPGNGAINAAGSNAFTATGIDNFNPNQGQPVVFKAGYNPFAFKITTNFVATTNTITWKLDVSSGGATTMVVYNFLTSSTGQCRETIPQTVRITVGNSATITPSQLSDLSAFFVQETGGATGRFSATVAAPDVNTENVQLVSVTVSAPVNSEQAVGLDLLTTAATAFSANANYVGNIATRLGIADASQISVRFPYIRQGDVVGEVSWDQLAPVADPVPTAASSIFVSIAVVLASLLAVLFI